MDMICSGAFHPYRPGQPYECFLRSLLGSLTQQHPPPACLPFVLCAETDRLGCCSIGQIMTSTWCLLITAPLWIARRKSTKRKGKKMGRGAGLDWRNLKTLLCSSVMAKGTRTRRHGYARACWLLHAAAASAAIVPSKSMLSASPLATDNNSNDKTRENADKLDAMLPPPVLFWTYKSLFSFSFFPFIKGTQRRSGASSPCPSFRALRAVPPLCSDQQAFLRTRCRRPR
jgi:hypothetical protein